MKRSLVLASAIAVAWAAPLGAQHAAHSHADLDALDPATRAEAERELDTVRAATAHYRDHAAAVADGYRRFEPGPGDPLMGEHWYRPDRVREPLDLTKPSTLIYAPIGGERRLIAVAYTVYQEPGMPLPEGFAGDADRWHVHDVAGLASIALSDRPVVRWIVENRLRGGPLGRRVGETDLVMLHAWIGMDNPQGVFANRNLALPYARAGLPATWARPGGAASARGVGLLLPDACDDQLQALDRLAKLDREQETAIQAACDSAAADVAAARDRALGGGAHAAFNDAAARASATYALAVGRTFTGDQKERVTALLATTPH